MSRFFLALAVVATLTACDSASSDDFGDDLAVAPTADATAAAASLGGDECTTTLGAITVENVIVPSGALCRLEGTIVQGNVQVLTNGRLITVNARIGGNVQAEGARSVKLKGGSVDGSVQLGQGRSGTVSRVVIDSDLQIEQNTGAFTLDRNRVRGNLQANQNTGGLVITANRVSENLQCQANSPAPTGGGNTAGDKEGQCASL